MSDSIINKKQLESIFNDFRNKKIIVIGDVMLDSYLWGKVSRVSPEAPVPVVLLNSRETRLGGAANVAVNMKKLGVRPLLFSIVGDDNEGNEFLRLLEKNDISSEYILKSSFRPTTIKSRIIGNNQQQLLRMDTETEELITREECEWLKKKFHESLRDTDAVVIEDYDKGVLGKELIEYIITGANSSNIPTVVDPKKKNFLSFTKATMFKPNLKELYEGLGFSLNKTPGIDELKKAVHLLFERSGIKIAMITLGDEGIFISDKNSDFIISSHKRSVYDVSGAGDTVAAVAALCLSCGLDIRMIAELANIAGGLVCEKVGVVPIDKESFFEEAVRLLTYT